MKEFKVRLSSMDDVQSFASAASKQHCEITVLSEDEVIDATSIMGLVSLNLTRPLTVRYSGPAPEAFLDEIREFVLVPDAVV